MLSIYIQLVTYFLNENKIFQANTNSTVFWSVFYTITHDNALKSAKQEIENMVTKYKKNDLNFTKEELKEMTVLS